MARQSIKISVIFLSLLVRCILCVGYFGDIDHDDCIEFATTLSGLPMMVDILFYNPNDPHLDAESTTSSTAKAQHNTPDLSRGVRKSMPKAKNYGTF